MTKDDILKATAALDPSDLWSLTWELMDKAGIVPFVALSVNDMMEDLEEDEDLNTATEEEVLEALQTAALGDYSQWADAAVDEFQAQLSTIIAQRETTDA